MSWTEVCGLEELPTVGAAKADVDGVVVAVVRVENGTVHAINDTCTHGQVSLSEGEVIGIEIECWLHASRFDLITGRPTCLPATIAVAVYPVKIEDDVVYVDVTRTSNNQEM